MWYRKTIQADGIILASPTHFGNVSVEMMSYIDRVGYMTLNGKLKHKIGAALTACHSEGSTGATDAVCNFLI